MSLEVNLDPKSLRNLKRNTITNCSEESSHMLSLLLESRERMDEVHRTFISQHSENHREFLSLRKGMLDLYSQFMTNEHSQEKSGAGHALRSDERTFQAGQEYQNISDSHSFSLKLPFMASPIEIKKCMRWSVPNKVNHNMKNFDYYTLDGHLLGSNKFEILCSTLVLLASRRVSRDLKDTCPVGKESSYFLGAELFEYDHKQALPLETQIAISSPSISKDGNTSIYQIEACLYHKGQSYMRLVCDFGFDLESAKILKSTLRESEIERSKYISYPADRLKRQGKLIEEKNSSGLWVAWALEPSQLDDSEQSDEINVLIELDENALQQASQVGSLNGILIAAAKQALRYFVVSCYGADLRFVEWQQFSKIEKTLRWVWANKHPLKDRPLNLSIALKEREHFGSGEHIFSANVNFYQEHSLLFSLTDLSINFNSNYLEVAKEIELKKELEKTEQAKVAKEIALKKELEKREQAKVAKEIELKKELEKREQAKKLEEEILAIKALSLPLAIHSSQRSILNPTIETRLSALAPGICELYSTSDLETLLYRERIAVREGLSLQDPRKQLPYTMYSGSFSRPSGQLEWLSSEKRSLNLDSFSRYFLKGGDEGSGWIGHDICRALLHRFVDRFYLPESLDLSALGEQPCLFLANQQVGIESFLFSLLAVPLLGQSIELLVRKRHVGPYLKGLGDTLMQDSDYKNLPQLSAFHFENRGEHEIRRTMGAWIDGLKKKESVGFASILRSQPNGGEPRYTKSAEGVLDAAYAKNVRIIPVRFDGGLVKKNLGRRLDFPYGMAKIDIIIGEPIQSSDLPTQDRRSGLNLINSKIRSAKRLRDVAESDRYDEDFGKKVHRRMLEAQVNVAQAITYCSLKEMKDQGKKLSRQSLDALAAATLKASPLKSAGTDPLLQSLASTLLGVHM